MSQINESRVEAVPGDKLWMRWLLLLAALFIWSGSFAADRVTFIHTDLYGSPVAATNESAEVVWRAHHTPYGEEVLRSDFPRDSVGYTGHLFDNQTELSYFQARTYDPAVGRFMGVDPVGFDESNIHSFSKYTYANSNPYKYIDPDGRSPISKREISPFPPSFDDVVNEFAGPFGGGGGIRASSRGSGNNPTAGTKGLADPKAIRFSQDSIKGTFRDGRSVQDLAAGLKNGSIKASDIPAIRTVQRNGQTVSIDNRRLAAFKEAGVPIRTRPATASEIAQAQKQGKFSAGASGSDTIRIRGQ